MQLILNKKKQFWRTITKTVTLPKKINNYVCTCIHKSTSEHQIKGQISENNRVAIVFEQGILEITEPDTVFIIITEADTVFIKL